MSKDIALAQCQSTLWFRNLKSKNKYNNCILTMQCTRSANVAGLYIFAQLALVLVVVVLYELGPGLGP